MEPFRRGSISHSALTQRFIALATPAPNSRFWKLAPLSPVGFRMPSWMLFSSSNCFCMKGRLLPGRPPSGGQASRREAFGWPFGYAGPA